MPNIAVDLKKSGLSSAQTTKLDYLTVTAATDLDALQAKLALISVASAVDLNATDLALLSVMSDVGDIQADVNNGAYTRSASLRYKEFAAITAPPTAALSSPNIINIFPVNTSGGDVNLGSIATPAVLGLTAGDRVIFRKSTTDANRVLYPTTIYGQSVTITLAAHYSATLAQIDLLVVNSTTYLLLNH